MRKRASFVHVKYRVVFQCLGSVMTYSEQLSLIEDCILLVNVIYVIISKVFTFEVIHLFNQKTFLEYLCYVRYSWI
jgi:hypothetical protein